jgi:type 1 glutamine amidotransferase
MSFSTMVRTTVLTITGLAFLGASLNASDEPFKLLVFTKTAGFHHGSIPKGVEAIKKIGAENNFTVEDTDDAGIFTDDKLKPFSVVVSISTTGDVMNDDQQAAFKTWFKADHGWVGIHAASDSEYKWEWYHGLVGAYFKGHPGQQKAKLDVVDNTFPATSMLPAVWERADEWYNFRALPEDVHVVLKIDESSYKGGDMNGNHPMAWWHIYEGGRAFYTELGHTDESYTEPLYLKHITGAILWAAGRLPNKVTPDPAN